MIITKAISVDWGVTGLAGTLGYTVYNSSNTILIARTTSGVTESPTGSGLYLASISTWNSAWSGRIVWDDSAGTYAEDTFDSLDSSSTIDGPSTVTLTFKDELGNPVPFVRYTVVGQGTAEANVSGVATLGLDDATYTVNARPTNSVIFPTTTLVVSGTTALTITGTALAPVPTPPTGPVIGYKQRYQNPTVGDTVVLQMFAYNSNNRTNFDAVQRVEIYFVDPNVPPEDPNKLVLITTIASGQITNIATGQYQLSLPLNEPSFVIGDYVDRWYVLVQDQNVPATIDNHFQVYPDLWFTAPSPVVYDFSFTFRPNKIRKGSKKYLIIDIAPNVPKATDIARYYENLAITSPISISIELNCGDCVPAEKDLRMVAECEPVELREKNTGYYFIDTTDMECGVYDVHFSMPFGESLFISDNQQLQIY